MLCTRATEDAALRRFAAGRVSDGTRTRDRLDHNQELYQLSYAHHVSPSWATPQRLLRRQEIGDRSAKAAA